MKKHKTDQLVIYFILAFLIFAVSRQMYTKIMLSSCKKITVATPYNITGGFKTGNSLRFTYNVNGNKYEGSYGLGNGNYTNQAKQNIVSHRCYVRFSCAQPGLSELIFDKEVPGSIVTAPKDGWSELPTIE